MAQGIGMGWGRLWVGGGGVTPNAEVCTDRSWEAKVRARRGRSQEGQAAEEGVKVAPGVRGWGSGHKMGARANGGRKGWAGWVKGASDTWRSRQVGWGRVARRGGWMEGVGGMSTSAGSM